jgi:hypothetical protein
MLQVIILITLLKCHDCLVLTTNWGTLKQKYIVHHKIVLFLKRACTFFYSSKIKSKATPVKPSKEEPEEEAKKVLS